MYKRLRKLERSPSQSMVGDTYSITWLDSGYSQGKVLPRDGLFVLELEAFYEMRGLVHHG